MQEVLFKCKIDGRPIVKKNSRRVFRRYGRTIVLPSAKYTSWETTAVLAVTEARAGMNPLTQPLEATFRFYFEDRRAEADTSNLIEGSQDVLQACRVIKNDKIIKRVIAEKFFGEAPRVEIELRPIG